MEEQIKTIKCGFDLGNKYVKVVTDMTQYEFAASFKEISKFDYEDIEGNDENVLVNYDGKYYIVGSQGTQGIETENKGSIGARDQASILKLVGLSKDMQNRDIITARYNIVTGTPFDHYEKYHDGYKDLFLSGNIQEIEVNHIKYKINVEKTFITKQSACIILALKDRKQYIYLLLDLGGGTLDLSLYEKGLRTKGTTIDFSLNRVLVELGKMLNKYIDIDGISVNNGRFLKDMETLVMNGHYKGTKYVTFKNKNIKLSELVDGFLQRKTNEVIDKALFELKINSSDLVLMKNVFAGGGAKLLERQLMSNTKLNHKQIFGNPAFANSISYYNVAKLLGEDKWFA